MHTSKPRATDPLWTHSCLQVSFIQIMKAVNPGFTLAICTLMGLERSSPMVVLSITMISVGTAVATLV